MPYADRESQVRLCSEGRGGVRSAGRRRALEATRVRVLHALRSAETLGALRDRAWEHGVSYSTLRRWVASDASLLARHLHERRARLAASA